MNEANIRVVFHARRRQDGHFRGVAVLTTSVNGTDVREEISSDAFNPTEAEAISTMRRVFPNILRQLLRDWERQCGAHRDLTGGH